MRDDHSKVPSRWIARVALTIAMYAWVTLPTLAVEPTGEIDFAREVRPILSDKCFHCHGPDPASRQADLRLDVWDNASDATGAAEMIVAGEPDASELISRITSHNDELRMPPLASGKSLTPEQIETLKRWVAQGAKFKKHWSFEAPKRPEVPTLGSGEAAQNPVDAFVLARLASSGMTPSPRAEPLVLLRRLSLDLIGLPPTIAEIDAFQSNVTALGLDKAYELEATRLLESPHYGERWGRIWLDAARYADSDGFEKDKPRDVWMYRDWVVRALNDDMPYDQFVVKQIAGDMLPNATQADRIATGFLRNSMTNEEGGADPEQFRMEAMFDRMDAVGKAVLGLTIQCAQCHTHKYDPITHTDYYRMFAFLNNCHERTVAVYTDEEEMRRQQLMTEIKQIEVELQAATPDWRAQMAKWETSVLNDQPPWNIVRPDTESETGQRYFLQPDGSILTLGYSRANITSMFPAEIHGDKITAVRLELLNDPELPLDGPGRSFQGLCALTEFSLVLAPLDNLEKSEPVKIKSAMADVNPAKTQIDNKYFYDEFKKERFTGPIEMAIDANDKTAWGIDIGPARSNVPRKALFVLEKPIDLKDGVRLTFQLEQWHGQNYEFGPFDQNVGHFRFSITSAENPQVDPLPAHVRDILAILPANRTKSQVAEVFSYWRTTVSKWQAANDKIESLWRQHPPATSQLTVTEREVTRPTHRLDRGSFLAPLEKVEPGVPEFLHPLAVEGPRKRLAFAHWLADRKSPTTARTLVNRVWQAYFGIGLSMTVEDVGTQGEPPSHPELLDWLAVEFMDHGWSLKHLHRLIVNSATYQQSSNVDGAQLAQDPENRLLERGPRYRVDAETVRDLALAASGLLNLEIGGRSVYPPAPKFLFEKPASFDVKPWYFDDGAEIYRRALYTFRYRTSPYPVLQNFDAPTGEVSCPRRSRSNTPIQALTTLNEGMFVDCARELASRVISEGGESDSQRLTYVMRRCVGREPRDGEFGVLQKFLEVQRSRFASSDADARLLATGQNAAEGEAATAASPASASVSELAAWTALARVVLNLDQTITKE
jgi:mono/diheme cytochrome c family protein